MVASGLKSVKTLEEENMNETIAESCPEGL